MRAVVVRDADRRDRRRNVGRRVEQCAGIARHEPAIDLDRVGRDVDQLKELSSRTAIIGHFQHQNSVGRSDAVGRTRNTPISADHVLVVKGGPSTKAGLMSR